MQGPILETPFSKTDSQALADCGSSTDPWADRKALESLAQWCEQFSPAVGLEQSDAPESLLLDITGLAHLFGGEAALTALITGKFRNRGLGIRLAIADTVGAAWATSHFGSAERGTENGKQKAAGRTSCSDESSAFHSSPVFIVPPGQTAAALRGLPVEALRLPAETVELLHALGIHRIGQLEAIPRDEFLSRFGPILLKRWDEAMGQWAEPVLAHRAPPEFAVDLALEYPLAHREAVEAALEPLIGQVSAGLRACGQGALRLECRLDCRPPVVSAALAGQGPRPAAPIRIFVGLFQPTAAAKHLFQLVQMQLERLRLPAPVAAIRLGVTATAPLEYRQQDLFADRAAQPSPRHLALLVDRLSSRLGRHAVTRVRLMPEAQPELACRYDPLTGNVTRRRPSRVLPAELPPRPLRLLPRPAAIAATCQLHEATVDQRLSECGSGVPARFFAAGRWHRVSHAWGPERIETGWWRGQAVGRDYYRIETSEGRRFWLYRRLRDGQWFLHGMFD